MVVSYGIGDVITACLVNYSNLCTGRIATELGMM